MKKIISTLIFTLTFTYSIIFAATPINNIKLSKYGSVYDSPANNATLTVEPFATDPSKALIKIQGIQSKLDGVIMVANIQKDNDDDGYDTSSISNYFIQWQGRSKNLMQTGGELIKSANITLPDTNQKFALVYNKQKSQHINQNDLLMVYKQQLRKGIQASISLLNRSDAIQNEKDALRNLENSVKSECGKKIPMSVNWKTISNDFIINYSVSSYCGTPLNNIASYCDFANDDKHAAKMKKAILTKVKRIQCQVGKKHLGVSLAHDGTLTWVTVANIDNQDDFFKYNLEGLLTRQ